MLCVGHVVSWRQRKHVHNAQIFVWEHVCGGFLLKFNIFDVYMLPEVVWKFFLLLFALLFAKSFCSAFVCFGCRKLVRNAPLVRFPLRFWLRLRFRLRLRLRFRLRLHL